MPLSRSRQVYHNATRKRQVSSVNLDSFHAATLPSSVNSFSLRRCRSCLPRRIASLERDSTAPPPIPPEPPPFPDKYHPFASD